jgi:hypothetical protein
MDGLKRDYEHEIGPLSKRTQIKRTSGWAESHPEYKVRPQQFFAIQFALKQKRKITS